MDSFPALSFFPKLNCTVETGLVQIHAAGGDFSAWKTSYCVEGRLVGVVHLGEGADRQLALDRNIYRAFSRCPAGITNTTLNTVLQIRYGCVNCAFCVAAMVPGRLDGRI